MKEHPILFSTPMVLAILDGRKTQTRRVVSLPGFRKSMEHPGTWYYQDKKGRWQCLTTGELATKCPCGQPGDQLWVRETWKAEELESGLDGVRYAADNAFVAIQNTRQAAEQWGDAAFDRHGKRHTGWRPSIFMPRWASRIQLEVVRVRVQRLHEISSYDACAEGIVPPDHGGPVRQFAELWQTINESRGYGWDVNPWVWVVEFKRI